MAMHSQVSPDTVRGQWMTAQGSQASETHRRGTHDHGRPGHVLQLRGEDGWPNRVAHADEQHEDNPGDGATAEVESHEEGDPDRTDAEPEVATRRDAVLGAADLLPQHRKERHAADEQTGQRARDVLFGGRHQKPRDAELDHAEDGDPFEILEERPKLALAPDNGRQQQGDAGPVRSRTRTPGFELTNRHANEQIGEPPDHRHGKKQGPATSRHALAAYLQIAQILNFS